MSPPLRLIASVMTLTPVQGLLAARRASTGRPAESRGALAIAFVAKAVLNLPTTRSLIAQLKVDASWRRLCGWQEASQLPDESTFSRAFAEFAATALPQQLHAALIESTQTQRLIGHIARDSTAIQARERFPEPKPAVKKAKAKRRRGKFARAKAGERGTRIQRQRRQSLEVMLRDLPSGCDIGVKKSRNGHEQYWRGYKLHLDVADGQVPISAVPTPACTIRRWRSR